MAATKSGALRRVGDQLGINAETLRRWVSQAEIDQGERAGLTSVEAQRIAALEREVKELCRANEILRTSAAFRLHGEIGLIPPAELEDHHYRPPPSRPPWRRQFGVEAPEARGRCSSQPGHLGGVTDVARHDRRLRA